MELEVHRRFYLLLPQKGLEIQTPLFTACQYDDGEPRRQVVGQVGNGGLQTDAERGQLLGGDGEKASGPGGILGGGEGVQIGHGPVVQRCGQLLPRGAEHPQPSRQCAAFGKGGHILIQLPQIVFAPLHEPGGLADQHRGVLRQIVHSRRQLGIDKSQIPVDGGEGEAVCQHLPVLPQCGEKAVRGPLFLCRRYLFVQSGAQPRQPPPGQLGEHLGGGEDAGLVQLDRPPLGGNIKEAHGVHLVPEQLHPYWLGVGGGEEVQNAPPQGELAHPLHLLAPGVAGGGQGLGQVV